ncbi:hypothetical protein SLEP1_g21054 [Rubroshorea leprosula]|uniref:Uncharacterized protein n=1 Tax=Rubroshorea leprosula TaxID=152421 RepID=A0AAV5JDY6_9ROSI|nr:hypothetical protein SLEP1_g21054 [Rubroshorea leprosula]
MERTRFRARGAARREASGTRQRQGHRRWIPRLDHKILGQATTFFIYNFPKNLEVKELWYRFQMYGKVIDVFVPKKRDKWGKRFGFLHLLGVHNESQMVRRLNEIWIDSYKLRVKTAEDRSKERVKGTVTRGKTQHIVDRLVKPGQSYTQVTRQQNEKEEVASYQILKAKRSIEKDRDAESQEESMEFTPTQDELKWLEGGRRRVLLTEKEPGYLIEFMNLNKELFDLWFVDIKPWDKEVQERSRLVWLRISGIPLKAWIDRCFKMIGESMGEVMMIHGDTKTKSILCEGRILVICSAEHKIVKQVSLKVEEQMYETQVIEEEWRSDPDWWLSNDDQQKDDVSMDEEHSMHDNLLNSNFKSSEEGKASWHAEEGDADIEDGASGPSKTNGPLEGGSAVPIAGIGDEGGCRGVIEEVGTMWNSNEIDWVMKESIGASGGLLCIWNKKNFAKTKDFTGDGYLRITGEWGLDKVEQIDMKNEEIDLDEFKIIQRQEGFQKMWDIMRRREVIWKQKSRSNWVHVGDANMRFFHRVANGRKAQNHITGLLRDGCWVEELEQVKKEVYNYFSKLFQGDTWNRPKPCGVSFKQISAEEKQWLERPFSIEEIEEGLRSYEGSKAPGPDEYNFNFLKFAWDSLKEDFMSFFAEFHKNGRLVSGLNSSFLTLIPKKFNSMELKDYRPISLIGCVYKLLTKVLASRIKAVMPRIISETQSAFLRGRQLVDGVLVLNEVVEEVKRRKQLAFVFKANFAKAYDCVDWSFLEWMMDRLGFGIKWRGWIMECLSTSKISVLVNGSPTEEFKVGKGLRQGDPLSPFLFLMIGEGLNGLVQKVVLEAIMGKADIENIIMVKTIQQWFELMSGLQINFSKSNIYGYNVPTRWVEGSASMLRCGVGKSSFIYLGMPVDGNPRNKKLWELVIKKFRAKLAVWKATLLSFGGRLTLLNSGINGVGNWNGGGGE